MSCLIDLYEIQDDERQQNLRDRDFTDKSSFIGLVILFYEKRNDSNCSSDKCKSEILGFVLDCTGSV